MSFLLPLAVRGAGTVDVECLGGHIHRLAHAHGISASRLLEDLFHWYGLEHHKGRKSQPAFKANGGLAVYARPNETAEAILEVLTAATGRPELRSTTFLALLGALHRSSRTFSPHFRWCPICMDEFRLTGDPGYFKLLWLFLDITHCPTHGAMLIDQCPYCHSHQGGLGKKTICRHCQVCGAELGEPSNETGLAPSWENPGHDLLELVSLIANDTLLTFPVDGVHAIVSHLFDKAWASEDELRLWKQIPQHDCISLASGDTPISLLIARRVAYQLGMSLTDLLSGNIAAASHVLDPEWTETLPPNIRPKARRASRDRKAVLKATVALLKDLGRENPPPLRVVANRIGVSPGYLTHHFPVLVRNIVDKHREWAAQVMAAKHQTARLEALRYFQGVEYLEGRYSRKDALRQIRKKTGLPRNLLRKEINFVYLLICV